MIISILTYPDDVKLLRVFKDTNDPAYKKWMSGFPSALPGPDNIRVKDINWFLNRLSVAYNYVCSGVDQYGEWLQFEGR